MSLRFSGTDDQVPRKPHFEGEADYHEQEAFEV